MDNFWTNDPSILFNKDRLIEFFPTKDQTVCEMLNSISRCIIYSGIILTLYVQELKPIIYTIIILSFIIFVEKNRNKTRETFSNTKRQNQFGFMGPEFLNGFPNDPEDRYSIDASGNQCIRPTVNNPFGNVLMSDYYTNPNRPAACDLFGDIDQHGTMDQAEEKFGNNLFRDVDDVFGRTNSQRQFYTNPSTTIPNDQSTFARWLYGDARSCKDDPYDCVPYQRLQQNKFIFPDPTVNPISTKKMEI